MFFSSRYMRPLLRAVAALGIVVAVLLACTAFFLHRNPQALAEHLADEVQKRTGIACAVGSVAVVLLPVPALALADLHMRSDDMELRVAYATVRPALLPLLRGAFAPGKVALLRPQLLLRLPVAPQDDASPHWQAAIPDMLDSTHVQIMHGSLDLQRGDGLRLVLDAINADARLHAPAGVNGVISLDGGSLYRQDALLASLDALSAEVQGQPLAALRGAAARALLTARLRVPQVAQNVDVRLDLAQNTRDGQPVAELRAAISGHIPREGQNIAFSLQGEASGEGQGPLRLRGLRMALDQDSLAFDGDLTLRGPSAPRLAGSLDIRRLSLTQWFGFARQLPPGLQNTLHTLRGSLDFTLDREGLDVPRIDVAAADGRFTGRGGVPRWAEPVVVLDLTAPTLTLGDAFPEAEGKTPAPPAFAYAAFTPEPGSPEAEAMPGPDVGYDIRLRAGLISAWKLELGEVGFRCQPGGKGQALMTFDAGRVYGGKGEGRLLLRHATHGSDAAGNGDTGYSVKASLKNIQTEQVLQRWGGAWLGGKLTMDADFRAQGRHMAAFLASLDGYAAVRLDNGFILSGGGGREKQPFTRLSLEGKGKAVAPAASAQSAELTYNGQWKAALDAPHIKGGFQAEGPLSFAGKGALPVQLRKAPGHLSLTLGKELTGLDEALKADVSGRFSAHSGQMAVNVEDAQATLAGMTLRGQARVGLAAPGLTAQGRLSVDTADARRALRLFAPSLAPSFPKAASGKASGRAAFSWGDSSLSLSDMELTMDGSTVSGSCSGQWKGRPQWKLDLAADTLNLDRYMPPEPSKAPKARAESAAPLPWNLAWIRDNDVQGSLRAKAVVIRRFTVRDVHVPLRMRNGVLDCPAIRGTLYGAPAHLSLKAEAGTGLNIQAALEADGVDMLALTLDRPMSSAMGGRAQAWARVQGLLHSGADMPGALDGAWRLRVADGFIQSRNSRGALTGSLTNLGVVQASGSLEKGVLRSDNLSMAGPDMRASGGGWVNMGAETLDVNLTVSMGSLAEFPVRFYGSLDNPQRSINAGKAIVDTLGTLGSGVLDVMGDVLGGALRLLR